jgi:hypothetical protein
VVCDFGCEDRMENLPRYEILKLKKAGASSGSFILHEN